MDLNVIDRVSYESLTTIFLIWTPKSFPEDLLYYAQCFFESTVSDLTGRTFSFDIFVLCNLYFVVQDPHLTRVRFLFIYFVLFPYVDFYTRSQSRNISTDSVTWNKTVTFSNFTNFVQCPILNTKVSFKTIFHYTTEVLSDRESRIQTVLEPDSWTRVGFYLPVTLRTSHTSMSGTSSRNCW